MITVQFDDCAIQEATEDEYGVCATLMSDHSCLLVAHETPADGDGYGRDVADILLTADGWSVLVEMYALRRPEAFQRIAEKAQRLRKAQQRKKGKQ